MVFPSTLIISSSVSQPLIPVEAICRELHQSLSVNNPDLKIIDQTSGWGIDVVRSLRLFLAHKPYSHQNLLVIINQADQLNTEAQNALLKTLEEPGDNHYLILITAKPSSLLSTVVSRCRQINTQSLPDSVSGQNQLVFKGKLTADLLLADQLTANKDLFPGLVQQEIARCHQQLITSPSLESERKLEKLIRLTQMINANVDPKSALDYFFLN